MAAFRKSIYRIAKENILFQNNDSFGYKLEAVITEIREKLKDKENISNELKQIEEIVFDRLKMKIKLKVKGGPIAATAPFIVSSMHALYNYRFQNIPFFRLFNLNLNNGSLGKLNDKTGFIDYDKVELGGVFSEQQTVVWMDFPELFSTYKLTTPEVTAVLLHELGHVFHIFSYSVKLETTNSVLNEIVKAKTESRQLRQDVVYKKLKTINPELREKEVESLLSGTGVAGSVEWIRLVTGSDSNLVKSQTSNSKYDNTTSERLADDFASKFGYGKHVMLALEKFPSQSYTEQPFYQLNQLIFELASMVATYGIGVSLLGIAPVVMVTTIASFVLLKLSNSGEDSKDYTYDNGFRRYKRIRNSIIEIIKDPDLDKVTVNNYINAIEIIDSVLAKTTNKEDIYDLIMNYIYPKSKNTAENILQQQELEDLANNDIFLRAAQLRIGGQS